MILSIIIPTKNRYTTLFSVVDMILSFNLNEDIEIVIQDNSEINNEALDFIEKRANYKNLKYYYSSESLSVIENSDKAVLNSNGEYVCFIGDDDGVMPNIVEVVQWMKTNDYKALKSYKPNYFWPNQKSNYLSNDTSGVLQYKKWSNEYKVINTQEALDYTLRKGGVTIQMLPCLYHGIVERKTLDKIFSLANTYFPGPSPDMANAIALTQVIDQFVYVDYPVIISGKSTKSTGGAGVLHQHVAKIEDVKHLPKDTSSKWDVRIPKYWTGPTIWCESVVKVLEVFNNQKAIDKLKFEYLYAYLFVFHNKQVNQIFNNFNFKKSITFYTMQLKIFMYRVKVFIKNRSSSVVKVTNVENINNSLRFLKS